jgi:hypothetical protein
MHKLPSFLLLIVLLQTSCVPLRKFKCSDCNDKLLLKLAGDPFAAKHFKNNVAQLKYKLLEDSTTYQLVYTNCGQINKPGYITRCKTLILFVSKSTCKLINCKVLI